MSEPIVIICDGCPKDITGIKCLTIIDTANKEHKICNIQCGIQFLEKIQHFEDLKFEAEGILTFDTTGTAK